MRFATRSFLWSFIPSALLLLGSFAAMHRVVQVAVRDNLRSSLRLTHESIARLRSTSELQNSRFLKVLGENATLKAEMELLVAEPANDEARRTVEEQLREICDTLKSDFLVLAGTDRAALAGVVRFGERIGAMNVARLQPPERGLMTIGPRTYRVVSTPIDQGEENIGYLSVGQHFDFAEFTTPAVLARGAQVLKSSLPGIPLDEITAALKHCDPRKECEVRLRGETYISLPMESIYLGEGHTLRNLQNVDSACGPVLAILRSVFLVAGLGALLATIVLNTISSRSIVRPIAAVISHLREAERTGVLPEFPNVPAPIQEIQDLTNGFNRAASAIHEANENLQRAYLEFAGSLASALDARDRYTAGHSLRVSELSCAIAQAMDVTGAGLEQIRIGSLLHDIGKIGITDYVLQKPGDLTGEELRLIQRHPTIGRTILEGVHGFQSYLPAIELHHENWNGTGYPHGLCGEATPLCARIIHVADAFDAMTTNRPYRLGMTTERALRALKQNAGVQFDPEIVRVFVQLIESRQEYRAAPDYTQDILGLHNLADAVGVCQPAGSKEI